MKISFLIIFIYSLFFILLVVLFMYLKNRIKSLPFIIFQDDLDVETCPWHNNLLLHW